MSGGGAGMVREGGGRKPSADNHRFAGRLLGSDGMQGGDLFHLAAERVRRNAFKRLAPPKQDVRARED